ncbi:fungal-specific transcription factor domain-containing protein [Aspergillus venezuelensis]
MQHSASGASVMPARRIMQESHSTIFDNSRSGNGPHGSRLRRRKTLACETCYQRKIKCEFEPSSDACIQCMRRNLNCRTIQGQGSRDSQRRSRYVKTLEERLRKTESLLRAAGIPVEPADLDFSCSSDDAEDDSNIEDDNATSTQRQVPGRRNAGSKRARPCGYSNGRDSSTSEDSQQSFDSRGPSALYECKNSATQKGGPPCKTEKDAYPLYIGRSTPLSILTREGVEWIKSRSGEANSLSTLLSSSRFDTPWAYWRPDVFYDVFSSQVFKPLPPRAEVFALLKDFFRTVNLIFPLYHEESFMELVEWQYTQQTCDDAARWASINIILALAYEYRFSNSQKSEKDREKAWLYYKNALSVFPELVLRRTDLLSVQALLGMALFLRGNSGSQSTVPIVTAAIRSSHRMGLHREIPRPHLSQVQQQQRKNVFWIAYVLDQSISIRLGNAPTQRFDDFDVEFPSDETVEGLMMADNKAFFPQVCRIAVIRSRIYRHFYSARALENVSTAGICELVHSLHAELQEWKNTSQFDTLMQQRGTGEDFLAGFASAGLFLMYYNSLIMIHRLPLLINFVYQSRADSIPELDLRLMLNQSSASAAVCVQAARDTLKLVNNLPWGDIAWIWSLLYFVFLAVMTIFANILRNSQQPTAKDDLQSLNMAATFFATLVPADGPCNYARFMTRMSTTFERIARAVFERDQKTLNVKPGTDSKPKHPKSRAAAQAASQQSSSTSTSPPTYSASPSVNIPNLEGLPPINSSGYVVPRSPTPSSSPGPTLSAAESENPPLNLHTHPTKSEPQTPNLLNIQHQHQNHHQQQQPFPYTAMPTTTSTPTSTTTLTNPPQNSLLNMNLSFPLPTLEEGSFAFSFPFHQPELWQIPITADWELGFGGQFLGNMFGAPGGVSTGVNGHGPFPFQTGTGVPPDNMAASSAASATGTGPTTAVPVSVPVSVPNPLMNGYGYPDGSAGQGPAQPQAHRHPSMWMGGGFPGGPFR